MSAFINVRERKQHRNAAQKNVSPFLNRRELSRDLDILFWHIHPPSRYHIKVSEPDIGRYTLTCKRDIGMRWQQF